MYLGETRCCEGNETEVFRLYTHLLFTHVYSHHLAFIFRSYPVLWMYFLGRYSTPLQHFNSFQVVLISYKPSLEVRNTTTDLYIYMFLTLMSISSYSSSPVGYTWLSDKDVGGSFMHSIKTHDDMINRFCKASFEFKQVITITSSDKLRAGLYSPTIYLCSWISHLDEVILLLVVKLSRQSLQL